MERLYSWECQEHFGRNPPCQSVEKCCDLSAGNETNSQLAFMWKYLQLVTVQFYTLLNLVTCMCVCVLMQLNTRGCTWSIISLISKCKPVCKIWCRKGVFFMPCMTDMLHIHRRICCHHLRWMSEVLTGVSAQCHRVSGPHHCGCREVMDVKFCIIGVAA